jgi:hypothetical protein
MTSALRSGKVAEAHDAPRLALQILETDEVFLRGTIAGLGKCLPSVSNTTAAVHSRVQ